MRPDATGRPRRGVEQDLVVVFEDRIVMGTCDFVQLVGLINAIHQERQRRQQENGINATYGAGECIGDLYGIVGYCIEVVTRFEPQGATRMQRDIDFAVGELSDLFDKVGIALCMDGVGIVFIGEIHTRGRLGWGCDADT